MRGNECNSPKGGDLSPHASKGDLELVSAIVVQGKSGVLEDRHERLAASLSLADLEIRRVYLIETEDELSHEEQTALAARFADPVLETAAPLAFNDSQSPADTDGRREVWIAYKRGVVDNENDSILRMCDFLGIRASAGKVATVYRSHDPQLTARITERLFNPNIEELQTEFHPIDSLKPLGTYLPVQQRPLSGLNDAELEQLGRAEGRNLNLRQMRQIREIEKRTGVVTTEVLLEALDARWSDHCSHTTWTALGNLLGRLIDASTATANQNIVSMFKDNAGIWDFYEGYGIAFKAETHNGPSAISAYFGQLTKLGGVLRDILGAGLGADPVGVFEYTATGLPTQSSASPNRPAPRQIADETIRAVREYGNTFGVPMMWSRMAFHPSYRAKPFALGGSIGLIPLERAAKGEPRRGDLLILIGGLTGNDGIHGASASSAGAVMDGTAVQIGSPLEEVKFRAAIIDLREAGCLRAVTDIGGAGLNSAVGEIGDPVGVWLNCALVPLKTAGLPLWRILLSESQERMVLAVIPERLAQAKEILARHHVRQALVGKFTGLGHYTVVYDPNAGEAVIESTAPDALPMNGEIGIDAPYELIDYDPEPIPVVPPTPTRPKTTSWPTFTNEQLVALMPRILCDTEVADQHSADSQYDSSVQGRRTAGPYEGARKPIHTGYWAAQLLADRPYAALFTAVFAPHLFEIDPRLALRQCFAAAVGTLVLAGSKRRDIALCDNFYTPHLSDGWAFHLVGMVDELAALVRTFGTPVISGKDSSAGSVRTDEGLIHVPPAVFFSAIGKTASFNALLRNEWTRKGSLLVRIGVSCPSSAATVAGRLLEMNANDVDAIDVDRHIRFLDALERMDRGPLRSGVQLGAGGVLSTLARGSIASGLGVELAGDLGAVDLLAEHRAGALVEIAPDALSSLPTAFDARIVGRLVGDGPSIRLNGSELLSAAAQSAWHTAFSEGLR
ncbi:MAG TPA: AIR synthase-related protein [Candidatus Baltobacteraceae bacterium]|nr:AIR synthase-related protein [Candidatus Baltobacteraceae bacterium]